MCLYDSLLLWCFVQSLYQAVQQTVQSRQADFEEANLQLQKLAVGDAQPHQLASRYETLLCTCKVSHFGCKFSSLVVYYLFLLNSKIPNKSSAYLFIVLDAN